MDLFDQTQRIDPERLFSHIRLLNAELMIHSASSSLTRVKDFLSERNSSSGGVSQNFLFPMHSLDTSVVELKRT